MNQSMVSAQIKMKALVVSRLMMGDITNWAAFERERNTASQIANRRTARSVSLQIGRGYRELSKGIQDFAAKNFTRICSTRLNDSFPVQYGADRVKRIDPSSCCGTNDGSNAGE
jgi:hypothetical protein